MEQEQEDVKYFTVIRGGARRLKCNHTTILVGDMVEIVPGDALSFDGILVRGSNHVEVDESMITGLSDCLNKKPFD
jgi:Ca2+ transporting ATPase